MPRFVVLEHHHDGVHWDFMIESAGVLRTWKLATAPVAGVEITATKLADHRIAYLDYEGEISGGRGFVTRWDCGEFVLELDDAAGVLVRLAGQRLRGRVHLKMAASGDWLFTLTSLESSG